MKLRLNKNSGAGFTLIEIAVSLFILTLVISSLLGPMAVQIEERQVREAERTMNEMLEALVGYAVTQTPPHLPCPDRTSGGAGTINDTANDGIEDFNTGTGVCTATNGDGNIPWATLGVSPTDAWGNRFRYLVTPAFSNRSPAITMTLASAGTLKVCASSPNSAICGGTTYVADNVPAVILSHGKNGYGAMNGNSNTQISTTGASAHETENAEGTYVSSMVSKPRSSASGQEFDDVVVWLSPNVLFNRLITANKLP